MGTNFADSRINFPRLIKDIPTPLMVLDQALCFIAANDCYLEMTHRTEAALLGKFVFDAFPEAEDRVAVMREAFKGALAGNITSLERYVFAIEGADGITVDSWWDCEQRPIFGTDGKIVGMMQHAHDVSREVAAERMRDAISIEYDHRVRNILSKVSAIARRTARSADSMQQFIADFDPRILSMARAHQLLAEGTWDRINLVDLVNGELAPFATPGSAVPDAVQISGPAVILSSRIAQALGMALHELATNAAKHGALSHAGGRLDVHWSIDATTGAVELRWNEANAAMIARPRGSGSGFGSIIIDRILPSEVAGNVTRDFTPRGLDCRITIPVPDKA